MKLKTVFAFVTGASVGSVITAVKIGNALHNYISNPVFVMVVDQKTNTPKKSEKTKPHLNYSKLFNNEKKQKTSVFPVICEKRSDASDIICQLNDIIDLYGYASAADYYDVAGINCASTRDDFKIGWTSFITPHDYSVEYINNGCKLTIFNPHNIYE